MSHDRHDDDDTDDLPKPPRFAQDADESVMYEDEEESDDEDTEGCDSSGRAGERFLMEVSHAALNMSLAYYESVEAKGPAQVDAVMGTAIRFRQFMLGFPWTEEPAGAPTREPADHTH